MGSSSSKLANNSTQPITNNPTTTTITNNSTTTTTPSTTNTTTVSSTPSASTNMLPQGNTVQQQQHAPPPRCIEVKFSNPLESNFTHLNQHANGMCLKISTKQTDLELVEDHEHKGVVYEFTHNEWNLRECDFKQSFTLNDNHIIAIGIPIKTNGGDAYIVCKLNERGFVEVSLTHSLLETSFYRCNTEALEFLDVEFRDKVTIPGNKFEMFEVFDKSGEDYGVELGHEMNERVVRFFLEDETFDLTSPNYYNASIQKHYPIFYQLSQDGQHFSFYGFDNLFISLKSNRTTVIPLVVTKNNEKINAQLVLEMTETRNCLQASRKIENLSSPNTVCSEKFKNPLNIPMIQHATRTSSNISNTGTSINGDSMFSTLQTRQHSPSMFTNFISFSSSTPNSITLECTNLILKSNTINEKIAYKNTEILVTVIQTVKSDKSITILFENLELALNSKELEVHPIMYVVTENTALLKRFDLENSITCCEIHVIPITLTYGDLNIPANLVLKLKDLNTLEVILTTSHKVGTFSELFRKCMSRE